MKLLVLASVLVWVIALISLCSRRDIEIHSKLTWVVTILVLNGLGAIIYLCFGPKRTTTDPAAGTIDPDAKPFTPEGESWNPILGENRLPGGQGLNPKQAESHGGNGDATDESNGPDDSDAPRGADTA